MHVRNICICAVDHSQPKHAHQGVGLVGWLGDSSPDAPGENVVPGRGSSRPFATAAAAPAAAAAAAMAGYRVNLARRPRQLWYLLAETPVLITTTA